MYKTICLNHIDIGLKLSIICDTAVLKGLNQIKSMFDCKICAEYMKQEVEKSRRIRKVRTRFRNFYLQLI